MSIYSDLRTNIASASGGANGPIGAINRTGGTKIRVHYRVPPDPRIHVHDIIPYMIGRSPDPTSTTVPPAEVERCLAWQFDGPAGPTHPGWRCFKISQI